MIACPLSVGSHSYLVCFGCDSRVVDKIPGEAFKAEIRFRNSGETSGTWSVNIAFESEAWTWCGTPEILTLKPNRRKTLTWTGNVPEDAPVGSVARLIVYYNDSFVALDWWICVTTGAELTIASSTVE